MMFPFLTSSLFWSGVVAGVFLGILTIVIITIRILRTKHTW